jgi:hypothetical protein
MNPTKFMSDLHDLVGPIWSWKECAREKFNKLECVEKSVLESVLLALLDMIYLMQIVIFTIKKYSYRFSFISSLNLCLCYGVS